MVPNRVIMIGRVPLTANGKVDLKLLHELAEQKSASAHAVDGVRDVAPSDDFVEVRITSIWRDVLGRDGDVRQGTFFQQGGTSLALVILLDQIYQDFKIRIPPRVALLDPRFEQLVAEVIDRKRSLEG